MNFHIRKMSIAALVIVSSILGGCANMGLGNSEYACAGIPERTDQGGVRCMSARQVYQMTEQPGPVNIYGADEEETSDDKWWGSRSSKKNAKSAAEEKPAPVDVSANSNHPLSESPISNEPIPLRSRAKIMRIWVAPWESTNGDLNVSGMVFTELDGRRWSIGVQEDIEAPTLSPLQTRALPTSD